MHKLLLATIFFIAASVLGRAQVSLSDVDVQYSGAWYGGLMQNNQSGQRFCAAGTDSSSGQEFRIVAYSYDNRFVEIVDERWRLPNSGISNFYFIVDDVRLEVQANTYGTGMSFDLRDRAFIEAFLAVLSTRSGMALHSAGGELLARFSLSGSAAAIRTKLACLQSL